MVDSSPRPIAASHVLHRLLVPRHPPFALDNLTTKMLASTVQFSTNDQPTTTNPTPNPKTPTPHPQARHTRLQVVCETGHAWHTQPTTTHRPWHGQPKKQPHPQTAVVPSGPNRVPIIPSQPHHPHRSTPTPHRKQAVLSPDGRCQPKTHQCLRQMSTPPPHPGDAGPWTTFAARCSLERR